MRTQTFHLKNKATGNSLGAQWLGPCALTTEGPGLMEELILQTTQGGQALPMCYVTSISLQATAIPFSPTNQKQ